MNYIAVRTENGTKIPRIRILDEPVENLETLEGWLTSDLHLFTDCEQRIQDVFDGQNASDTFWGNGYKVVVLKDYTEVHFNFESDNPSIKPCKLSTRLFKEVVSHWLKTIEC